MSTVLWSNSLIDGVASSDQEDLYALYKHTKKLDNICRQLALRELSSLFDDTDMLVNLDQLEMPEGIDDTNELMAIQGNWVDTSEAAELLGQLLAYIQSNDVRFGFIGNAHDNIIAELKLCLKFAHATAEKGGKFNFAVVM